MQNEFCGIECSEGHTYIKGCMAGQSLTVIEEKPHNDAELRVHAALHEQQGPLDTDDEAEDEPITLEDLLAKLIPHNAFATYDPTGKSWQWTTNRGIYRLWHRWAPTTAIIFEFKQPQGVNPDRVQLVLSLENGTAEDVVSFLEPILRYL